MVQLIVVFTVIMTLLSGNALARDQFGLPGFKLVDNKLTKVLKTGDVCIVDYKVIPKRMKLSDFKSNLISEFPDAEIRRFPHSRKGFSMVSKGSFKRKKPTKKNAARIRTLTPSDVFSSGDTPTDLKGNSIKYVYSIDKDFREYTLTCSSEKAVDTIKPVIIEAMGRNLNLPFLKTPTPNWRIVNNKMVTKDKSCQLKNSFTRYGDIDKNGYNYVGVVEDYIENLKARNPKVKFGYFEAKNLQNSSGASATLKAKNDEEESFFKVFTFHQAKSGTNIFHELKCKTIQSYKQHWKEIYKWGVKISEDQSYSAF